MQSADTRGKSWLRRVMPGLLWFIAGFVVATICWIRVYDPSVFRREPTVVNPVLPPAPAPNTVVVEPLAKDWDFDSDKVAWDVVLPLAQISQAVYQEGAELEATLKKLGMTTVEEFPKDSMYACVASNEEVVIVSFRGTNPDEVEDLLADARITSDAVKHGRIHRGFYRSTQGMLNEILAAVDRQKGGEKKVWVTGHSLGGAMAIAFAYECLIADGVKPAGVVTFGQPMVGNGELAQFLNSELRGKYLRFVHGGDIVPRVFPTYSHCGNLVWFTDGGFVFRKPDIRAATAKGTKDDQPPLEYEDGPQPMTRAEFEVLQAEIRAKRRPPRRANRSKKEVELAAAPAFLEDHYMPGYIHWIVTLREREGRSLSPAP